MLRFSQCLNLLHNHFLLQIFLGIKYEIYISWCQDCISIIAVPTGISITQHNWITACTVCTAKLKYNDANCLWKAGQDDNLVSNKHEDCTMNRLIALYFSCCPPVFSVWLKFNFFLLFVHTEQTANIYGN